ncbi:MAG: protein phosphatase 2C domain-containing protein [bacterium]|nr:protein phosphatase 2C domain-containing protein [bacterium]
MGEPVRAPIRPVPIPRQEPIVGIPVSAQTEDRFGDTAFDEGIPESDRADYLEEVRAVLEGKTVHDDIASEVRYIQGHLDRALEASDNRYEQMMDFVKKLKMWWDGETKHRTKLTELQKKLTDHETKVASMTPAEARAHMEEIKFLSYDVQEYIESSSGLSSTDIADLSSFDEPDEVDNSKPDTEEAVSKKEKIEWRDDTELVPANFFERINTNLPPKELMSETVQRITEVKKYIRSKRSEKIRIRPEMLQVAQDLADDVNQILQNLPDWICTDNVIAEVINRKVASEAHAIFLEMARASDKGVIESIKNIDTEKNSIQVYGAKKKGKIPRLNRRATQERRMTFDLNKHGEDYSVVNAEIGATILADGNSTGESSAEAAKRVSNALMHIFESVPAEMSLVEIQQHVTSRLNELPESCTDLEGMAGTTIVGSRYFPEHSAVVVVNIGDSETYIVSNGIARSLNDPAERGHIRNVIIKNRGKVPEISDDRKNKTSNVFVESVNPGDIVVHCSDGIENNLAEGRTTISYIEKAVQDINDTGTIQEGTLPDAIKDDIEITFNQIKG